MSSTSSSAGPLGKVAAWLLAGSVALWGAPAMAAAPVADPVTEQRAAELFEAGRYEEAVATFQALYDRGGSANFLYNIARIYEDDGKLVEAVDYYDRFIHARGAGLEERKLAAERASALRAILASSQEAEAVKAEAAPPIEPAPPPKVPIDASTDDTPDDDTPNEARSSPSRLAIGGYTLLGIGAVTLGAGGVVAGLALADDRALTSGPIRTTAPDLQTKGERKALAADILFGIGGALAISGAAMVITDVVRKKRKTGASARRWNLAPGPTVVGLGFQRRI